MLLLFHSTLAALAATIWLAATCPLGRPAALEPRFVHSNLPDVCKNAGNHCLTAQKGYDASPALPSVGCTVKPIDHDNGNWLTYVMSGACSGKVELLCPLGNGEPANHRAQASFSFGGTSSMSTSDQYLIGVTSDGKRLAVAPSRSGTISSSQAGADMQIWCKFWP